MIEYFKNDLDFIQNSSILQINPNRIDETLNIVKNKINKKTTLATIDEIFTQQKEFDKLQKFCEENNEYEIKILTSSLKKIKNGFSPLVNFLCWNNSNHNTDNKGTTQLHFDKKNFINFNKKKNKFILSWRKSSESRDKIVKGLIPNEKEIITYHSYKPFELSLLNPPKENNYLSWETLINQYKSSLISFVAETEYWIDDDVCKDVIPFTEKLILPLLTKSLPIIFAGSEYNDSLTELGIFTLNNSFLVEEKNEDRFKEVIEIIQNLTFEEVEMIYKNNIDKIEKNYKIIMSILDYPKLKFNINE